MCKPFPVGSSDLSFRLLDFPLQDFPISESSPYGLRCSRKRITVSAEVSNEEVSLQTGGPGHVHRLWHFSSRGMGAAMETPGSGACAGDGRALRASQRGRPSAVALLSRL